MSRPSPESSNKTVQKTSTNYQGIITTTNRTFKCYERFWNGVKTPNYFTLAAQKHGLPNNDHDSKITTRNELLLRQTISDAFFSPPRVTSVVDTFAGLRGNSSYPDHSYECDHSKLAYEQAKQRCIDRVKELDFNAAQALAEVQKTADLVGDTATRIAKTVVLFRKGKYRQGLKALGLPKGSKTFVPRKSAADNWLAIQYGWIPLLSDVRNAAEFLAKQPKPPVFTFTGTATESDSQKIYNDISSGLGGLKWFELGFQSRARMSLTFSVANHSIKTMSELGIRDPALLVWELLPYSFVVDWFLPVGKYLSSINYTDGLTFKGGYTMQYTENNWACATKLWISTGGGITTTTFPGNTHSSKNVFLSRRHLNQPPSVSLPRIKNPLSLTHMANGLALLSKAFR